jgi:hypothetical protein
MSAVLRRLLTILIWLACALALLPPPGFALCVDADGHLVIEAGDPGQGMCCLPGSAGPADESCRPDDCATCVDYLLAADDMVRVTDAAGAMPDRIWSSPAMKDEAPVRLSFRVLSMRAAGPRAPGASASTPLRL